MTLDPCSRDRSDNALLSPPACYTWMVEGNKYFLSRLLMQAFSLAIVRLFYWLHFLSVCDSFFANYYFTLSSGSVDAAPKIAGVGLTMLYFRSRVLYLDGKGE